MCEPSLPIDELKRLKFSLAAMSQTVGERGSYERENARNIARGIEARIDWVIRQLEAADEGERNMGA